MRRLFALALLTIGAAAPHADAGLIAFYTFEGNANDVSGNGNHGVVNGATLTSAGYEGQAYSFDGSNDFIGIPVDINPTFRPRVTMGAWANTDAVNAIRAILSHDSGGFDRNINLDGRDASIGARYSAFNGGGVTSAGPDPALVGEWVFVAARYDDVLDLLTLDVDNVRVTVAANPGAGFTTARIGSNPGFGEFFDGRIDNVFIFDEFLSDAEIDAIRRGGAAAIVPEPSAAILLGSALGLTLLRASSRARSRRPRD